MKTCLKASWIWLDLVGSGWIWLDLVGSGWIWLDLVGSGWIWLDLVGSRDRTHSARGRGSGRCGMVGLTKTEGRHEQRYCTKMVLN